MGSRGRDVAIVLAVTVMMAALRGCRGGGRGGLEKVVRRPGRSVDNEPGGWRRQRNGEERRDRKYMRKEKRRRKERKKKGTGSARSSSSIINNPEYLQISCSASGARSCKIALLWIRFAD